MKVTKSFRAVRPGKIYPETIPVGEDVQGELLEIAKKLGCVRNTLSLNKAPRNKDAANMRSDK